MYINKVKNLINFYKQREGRSAVCIYDLQNHSCCEMYCKVWGKGGYGVDNGPDDKTYRR